MRWRQIFRSNHLGHLTEDDAAVLRSLGVRSAFDFRGKDERTEALCGIEGIEVHSLPVEPTVVASLRAIRRTGTPLSPQHALEVMQDLLSQLCAAEHAALPRAVRASAGRPRAAGDLLHRRQGPHRICLRADPACARRRRRRDFGRLFVNQPLLSPRPSASTDLPDDVRQVLGSVQPPFLAAAFKAIDADYGDLENYLADGLALGPAERAALHGALSGSLRYPAWTRVYAAAPLPFRHRDRQ